MAKDCRKTPSVWRQKAPGGKFGENARRPAWTESIMPPYGGIVSIHFVEHDMPPGDYRPPRQATPGAAQQGHRQLNRPVEGSVTCLGKLDLLTMGDKVLHSAC